MSSLPRALWTMAVVAALSGVACDKVPLTAPTNTTIRLVTSVGVVPTNGTADITAVVIESAGTPVQNGTVVTFTSSLGNIEPREARTTNGQATVRYVAGVQSGTATIGAFSGGSRAEDVEILVGAAAAGAVNLRANPQAVPTTGGTVEIVATVVDTGGNALRGAPVTFSTNGGQLSQSTAVSDDNGEARTQLTTNVESVVTARVGGGSSAPTAELTIAARTAPAVTITAGTDNTGEAGIPLVFRFEPPQGGNPIRELIVNFGDGTVRNLGPLQVPSSFAYTYARRGSYTVTATATDTMNFTTTTTVVVVVTDAATVGVSFIATAQGSRVVLFTATPTLPGTGAGSVREFIWDFGDGQSRTTTGNTTSYRYGSTGVFTVRLRIVTTTGHEGYSEMTVNVPQ